MEIPVPHLISWRSLSRISDLIRIDTRRGCPAAKRRLRGDPTRQTNLALAGRGPVRHSRREGGRSPGGGAPAVDLAGRGGRRDGDDEPRADAGGRGPPDRERAGGRR